MRFDGTSFPSAAMQGSDAEAALEQLMADVAGGAVARPQPRRNGGAARAEQSRDSAAWQISISIVRWPRNC